MLKRFLELIYPPKCVLCQRILDPNVTDLCHPCRRNTPEFTCGKRNIPFVAQWTALWYYKDSVRASIHRFKFGNRRKYAESYARLLAMHLEKEELGGWDVVTWVPIGALRNFRRGYDQTQLLCRAFQKETGCQRCRFLKKIRNTPPQSGFADAPRRRANVLGAYKIVHPALLRDKRVLLLDDVVTTGATASECARMLLTAGAKSVTLAAVAAARQDK